MKSLQLISFLFSIAFFGCQKEVSLTGDVIINLKPGQTIVSMILPQKQSLQTFLEKLRPHHFKALRERRLTNGNGERKNAVKNGEPSA